MVYPNYHISNCEKTIMIMRKQYELGKMIGVGVSLIAAIGSTGCSLCTGNITQQNDSNRPVAAPPNIIDIKPNPSELPKSLHSNLSISYTGNDAQLSFEVAGKTHRLLVHCIRPGYVTFKPEGANDLSGWGAELSLRIGNKLTNSAESTLIAFVEQPEARITLMNIAQAPFPYN